MSVISFLLEVNNEGKGRFVPEFLFWRANIPSCAFVNIENRDYAVCTGNKLRNSGIEGWVGLKDILGKL